MIAEDSARSTIFAALRDLARRGGDSYTLRGTHGLRLLSSRFGGYRMFNTRGRMRIIGVGVMSLLLLAAYDTALGRPPAGRGPKFRPGPPAHAPASGLRRKHVYDMDLTFHAGLGLYVVDGHSDWYYHEGHFYRCHGGVWQISLRGDLWEPVVVDKLPPGLHKKVHGLDLTFDAGPGLYVVVGHSDWYYHQGQFYRRHNGLWQISLRGDLWEPVVVDKLPPGLQIKAKANGKSDPGDKGNSAVKSAGDNKPTASPDGSAKDSTKGQAGDANAGKPARKPADNGNAKPTGKGKKK
jgi:hypothetical protein